MVEMSLQCYSERDVALIMEKRRQKDWIGLLEIILTLYCDSWLFYSKQWTPYRIHDSYKMVKMGLSCWCDNDILFIATNLLCYFLLVPLSLHDKCCMETKLIIYVILQWLWLTQIYDISAFLTGRQWFTWISRNIPLYLRYFFAFVSSFFSPFSLFIFLFQFIVPFDDWFLEW